MPTNRTEWCVIADYPHAQVKQFSRLERNRVSGRERWVRRNDHYDTVTAWKNVD